MYRFPLAKREIHALKWVTLAALLVEAVMLAALSHQLSGRLGGSSVMELIFSYYRGDNAFFAALPDSSLFMFGVGILAFVQFYGLDRHFIFSLPVRQNALLRMKLLLGVCAYTLWMLFYGAGLVYIFVQNGHWLKDLYLYQPENIFQMIESQNNVLAILRYLFMLWLATTGVYALCVAFFAAIKNKIVAAVLSFLAVCYPSFLSSSLNNGLYDFYRNNEQSLGNIFFDLITRSTSAIRLLSLPEMPVYSAFEQGFGQWQSFQSTVAGQYEMSFSPYINVINHYRLKAVIALLAIAAFSFLAFRCFEAGRTGESKTTRRFAVAGVICVLLLLLCRVPAWIRLDPQTATAQEAPNRWIETPINAKKTPDKKKLEAYTELNQFLYEYTHYEDQEQQEEARRKAADFFGLESLGYFNISSSGNGLGFVFDADDFLSKTNIAAQLEAKGFSGLTDFIVDAERQFSERNTQDGRYMASCPYFYLDSQSKAVVVYIISAYPYQTEPGNTSLKLLFRSTLSYPDDYKELVQKLENEDTYFSQYTLDGHRDMLVFENTSFIAHIDGQRYYNNSATHAPMLSHPLKIRLYGQDGVIDSVTLSIVTPRDAEIQNPLDIDSASSAIAGCLDALGLSQADIRLAGEILQSGLNKESGIKQTGRISSFAYGLYTTVIQEDFLLVELKIR